MTEENLKNVLGQVTLGDIRESTTSLLEASFSVIKGELDFRKLNQMKYLKGRNSKGKVK